MRKDTFSIAKSITPPLVFFTFFNLYKRYQIAQSVSYQENHHNLANETMEILHSIIVFESTEKVFMVLKGIYIPTSLGLSVKNNHIFQ